MAFTILFIILPLVLIAVSFYSVYRWWRTQARKFLVRAFLTAAIAASILFFLYLAIRDWVESGG